ncbi:valine--tRNA ligase [Ureaplasma miroungigenitalium]|uniref:Valine--tRNA ligase n=1 Tax=Ureaplasma miroungigenitalium TaxID=1042321 RepID=A0ABT3BMB0_9BACT|nr:valine--tRNA ligase [Ureaplasma miroungigenitalium]MCV3728287.1 valine--tRNA ligase [Ureaplasma miroungigenitalium]MCV3734092.1 valine--tRNA ligase [Ureaplasma miroungigenitalium]
MQKLNKKYDPIQIQKDKHLFWKDQAIFTKHNPDLKPFTVVLPPPNVTGHLHIGHAYGFSLPDIIVRYKKLRNFDAFIIPGTDHAGIATQTKFEKILQDTEQQNKTTLGRTEFLKKLTNWKNEQEQYIRKQFAALNLGMDENHYLFTLDEDVNKVVSEVFVKLYNEKLIYQANKLVNWDPVLQTAISDVEVIHENVKGKLYYIQYETADQQDSVIVATSRPETMFGDKVLFMHPEDQRYKHLWNKQFINPINGQLMNVLLDDYIDLEFGTGVMKCTPAHDFNDYELAKKHNLELINIMNPDGTLNELCDEFANIDRLQARDLIVAKLKANNHLVKVEEYETSIGLSQRSNAVVEPLLSLQWFIKMQDIVKQTISLQTNEKTQATFYPPRFHKALMQWLENTQDWCISRQLWWGHRIPVYYHKQDGSVYVGVNPPADSENYVQDEDVLDTWFSSGLWPLLTTKWQKNPEFFNHYFPTSLMVTGMDILFFWVSRMMNFSGYLTQELPFKDVLIHGLIRDSQGRKMSKSLNNGIDPFDIINEYGLDAMRVYFASSTSIGEDLNFSQEKISSAWNYLNKIWNVAVFLDQFFDKDLANDQLVTIPQPKHPINQWIMQSLANCIDEYIKNMDKYNLVVVSKDLFNFLYDVYASKYLEYTKVLLDDPSVAHETKTTMFFVFYEFLKLLHPFANNLSEELWLHWNTNHESILKSTINPFEFNTNNTDAQMINDLIFNIRNWRAANNVGNKNPLVFVINNQAHEAKLSLYNQILKIVNTELVFETISDKQYNTSLIVNDLVLQMNFDNTEQINLQRQNLLTKKEFLLNEIKRCQNLLNNPKYLAKAPEHLVNKEKEKLVSFEAQLQEVLNLLEK